MSNFSRTRLAVAASLMAVLSLTTVGAASVSAEAGSTSSLRSGDIWCC